MEKQMVFVYGTLRQGGVRAMSKTFPDSNFIIGGEVSGCLYDLGAYPGLLLAARGPAVIGEIYEVSDSQLQMLDEIEGYRKNSPASSYYLRRKVAIPHGERLMTCWIYEFNSALYPRRILIESGDWIEYAKTKTEWPDDKWPDE